MSRRLHVVTTLVRIAAVWPPLSLLNGGRGAVRRHHPESALDLSGAGDRSLHLSGRRAAARRHPPREGRCIAYAATLEGELRRGPATVRHRSRSRSVPGMTRVRTPLVNRLPLTSKLDFLS